jgi:ribosomal protein L3 glutamine methyltransferase
MTSVRELIGSTAAEFESAGLVFGHGTDSAWDEAVALVLGVTGLEDDARNLDVVVEDSDAQRIRALAARRIDERVPLAYLLGRCRFAGLEFLVQPGIVIPRSPIGGLLAEGLQPWLTAAPHSVVDVCCGTGCLGILAALVFPDAAVTLVDVDPHALAVARQNVRLHGLEDRVHVVESDLLDGLPHDARFDLIVTNPPYVDAVDMAALPPEYRHEPAHGLAGGPEGIELVERLLAALPERLEPGGVFVCEVGNSAPALLRAHPDVAFVWPELPTGGEGVFLLFGDLDQRSSR